MYAKFWREKLVSDSKEVISDLEGLLVLAGEDLSEKGKEIRERLNARLTKAREQLKEVQETVVDKVSQGAEQTDGAIRENVYTSLGIATAAGLVVGLMLGRR